MKYQIAIVGLGYWGPNMVRNALSNVSVEEVHIYDIQEKNTQKILQNFSGVKVATSFENILQNPQIQAVIIATPVDTHYALAKQALLHQKHVLVEKPFTSTHQEAEELIAIAQREKLTLMVDHTFIYTPAIRKIKELITTGQLGDIYYYDSVRVNLGLFQRDVNVIWDLAPHDFSIMLHVLDKKPLALQAMGADHVGKGLEDVAYVHITFENNLIAHFHLNWLSPLKIRKTLIAGSKKMVVYDDLEPNEKIKIYDKGIDVKTKEEEYQTLIQYRSGDMYSPMLHQKETLQMVIEEFLKAITEQRKPLTDAKDGLQVVRLLEATQTSIKNGGKIVYLE
ncbi:MAG: gfo/Idh/MocA family oxidoreductase [Cytophagales bacterium]|nr:MAG: gfo/Idh/MocA family oxidoreductase [Cytophagales bacterium]